MPNPYESALEGLTDTSGVSISGVAPGSKNESHNNPWSITYANQPGASPGSPIRGGGILARFDTPQDAYNAADNLFTRYKGEGMTLGQAADKYFRGSGISQQEVDAYTKDITKLTGKDPNTPLKDIGNDVLLKAFAKRESGATVQTPATGGNPYAAALEGLEGERQAATFGPNISWQAKDFGQQQGYGMDAEFAGRLNQLADDFQKTYGRPLTVVSGFRTFDEQKRIWDSGVRPAAQPGHSRHERGAAVDVSKKDVDDVNKMDLSKYGLETLARIGDAVHVQMAGGSEADKERMASKIAAGGNPYAAALEGIGETAAVGPKESPVWTGAKRGLVSIAGQAGRLIDPQTALAMAGDYQGAADYVWEHPHLNAFSVADRHKMTALATDRLVKEMWPNGQPPDPGFLGGMVRDAISMWPLFLEASTLAPVIGGAIMSQLGTGLLGETVAGTALMGALGATEEDPYRGAALMAAQGAGFGATRSLTAALPFFTKFLARAAGGASIFGGLTAITGGSLEEVKRDAVFGLFMEVLGVPFMERAKATEAVSNEIKTKLTEIAEKAEATMPGYGGTVPYEQAKAGIDKAVMEYRASGVLHPALAETVPPKMLEEVRLGEELPIDFEREAARRYVELQQRDFPTTTQPGKVTQTIRKRVKGKWVEQEVERTSPAVEAFPAEEKLTPARMEWIVSAAGRERQLEIDRMDWEGGKGPSPWKESEGDFESRRVREAARTEERRLRQQQAKLDEYRRAYEKDGVEGWNQLEPEEMDAVARDMIANLQRGENQPILSEILPADVLADVKNGGAMPNKWLEKVYEALTDYSYPSHGRWKQWGQYLRDKQDYINMQHDALAKQSREALEQGVAPMYAPPEYGREAPLPDNIKESAREEVAKRYGINKDHLVYEGTGGYGGEGHELAYFQVTDPQSPRYGSHLSAKVAKEALHGRGEEAAALYTSPDDAIRNSYDPRSDYEAGRELRGFKAFAAKVSSPGEWEIWRNARDTTRRPEGYGRVEQLARNIGIQKVHWIEGVQFGGCFTVADGKPTLVFNVNSHPEALDYLAHHEMFHYLDESRHPGAATLVNLVDTNSDAFKSYRADYERGFEGTDLKFSDHTIKRELAADLFAGQPITSAGHFLFDAFKDKGEAMRAFSDAHEGLENGWKPVVPPENVRTDLAPMQYSGLKDWWDELKGWKAGAGRPTAAQKTAHQGMLDWARKVFAPETRTPQAMTTAQKWIESITEARASLLRSTKMMRDFKVEFDKMGYDEAWKLSAKMERGEEVPPEWRPYAQARQEAFDQTHKLVKLIREGELGYIKNYAPHLYADPGKAAKFFDTLGQRPLEGGKKFTKQRNPMNLDMDMARKNGLEPLFNNPMMQDMAGLMEQWRYIAGDNFIKSLEKGNLFIPIKDGRPVKEVPPDWVKTDPRVFRNGYAPRAAIDVIHNHLISEGGNLAFTKWKNLTSFWNAMHVSFSAFHAVTTLSSELAMGNAKGIPEFIGAIVSGDMGKAATALKKIGPMGVINTFKMGRMGLADFYNRGIHGPKVTKLVDIATKGGLLPEHTMLMSEQAADTFAELYQQLRQGKITDAARSMIHIAGKPIMGKLVPMVKYGSTLIRLDREINGLRDRYNQKYGAHWTPEVEAAFTADIGNIAYNERQFSENIFGEIPPDNLHWDRGLAKMVKGVIAYPSWNVGSARWIAGMIRGVGQTALGKPLDYQSRLSLQFGAGLILTIGVANTLMHMALNNGQEPEDWKDVLIGARTGRYLNNGQPERITIASYAKDLFSMATHPGKATLGKIQAPFSIIKELYDNADYFGTEIIPSRGTYGEKVASLGKYLGGKALPFGASNIMTGKSDIAKYGPLVGLRVVPRYLTNTPAMNRIDTMLQQQSPKARTAEASERSKKVADLRELGWTGRRQEMEEGIREARKEGIITPIQATHIRQETMKDKRVVQFGKLRDIEDSLEVYEKGTPDERKLWRLQLVNKWSRTTPEKRRKLLDYYKEVMALPVAEQMPEPLSERRPAEQGFSILNR